MARIWACCTYCKRTIGALIAPWEQAHKPTQEFQTPETPQYLLLLIKLVVRHALVYQRLPGRAPTLP